MKPPPGKFDEMLQSLTDSSSPDEGSTITANELTDTLKQQFEDARDTYVALRKKLGDDAILFPELRQPNPKIDALTALRIARRLKAQDDD